MSYAHRRTHRRDERAIATDTVAQRLIPYFDRPLHSALERATMALLCTGKNRTHWRGAPMRKDAISWVILTMMIQELCPGTIFDLGTGGGGTALWLLDQSAALGLDTMVVSVDMDDIRSPATRQLMAEQDRLRVYLGDLEQLAHVLPNALLASLPHPWLILEDAHVPSLPLLSYFHLNGIREGDYVVFGDTHREGPDVSGVQAHDMKTSLGAEKTRSVSLAMTVFGCEYALDTRYLDMFGHDASAMSNGILRRVTPAESAHIVEVDVDSARGYRGVSPADITRHLARDGHVFLRPRTSVDNVPYAQIKALLGIERANRYEQGSELRATHEDTEFLQVTRFPADQSIPPHNELYYTPTPPNRLAFACIQPPNRGGETTIYDGREAYRWLDPALRTRAESEQILWRRHLGPPSGANGLANTTWAAVFACDDYGEALTRARAQGYDVCASDAQAQVMTLDCRSWLVRDGCLATSVVGNHPWIYRVFYGGVETSHDEVRWCDGTPIAEADLRTMLIAYARARVHVRWTRRGEVLMIDNHRFAHGRQPWPGGAREIAVFMGS